MGPLGQCLQCVGEAKLAQQKNNGQSQEAAGLGIVVRDAVTQAPSWQQTTIPGPMGPQMAMACVPLPTCAEHLAVGEQPLQQRAAASGLILGQG